MRKKKNQDKPSQNNTQESAPQPDETMDVPEDQKVAFFPFHAINDFMTDEFRMDVVRTVFTRIEELPEDQRSAVERISKKMVQVPGFRSSVKAPMALKVKPAASAFEKSPHLVSAILVAWASLHSELNQQMHTLLTDRGWEVLPLDADRTRLPGFLSRWPKKEDFDVINAAYAEAHPDVQVESNSVSLMAVWVSGRLPYTLVDDEEDFSEEIEA